MLTLLFLGLWQGFRHHTDAIRALRLQLHELEQQQTEVNSNSLMEEQLEFLQRRQQELEKQIGETRRSQQSWRIQERQRRQSTRSEPGTTLDLIPIP
jgi:chromosome condensin MukBEF ATPase and DNA-binding subunit MukB